MDDTAIRGDKTLAELAEQRDVHPNQILEWKQQLLESVADVSGSTRKAKAVEPDLKVYSTTAHARDPLLRQMLTHVHFESYL